MCRIINLAEDGSGARHSADALFITAKAAELFMTRRLWDARAVCVGAKRSKILPGDSKSRTGGAGLKRHRHIPETREGSLLKGNGL